jgi:hypothetical protein
MITLITLIITLITLIITLTKPSYSQNSAPDQREARAGGVEPPGTNWENTSQTGNVSQTGNMIQAGNMSQAGNLSQTGAAARHRSKPLIQFHLIILC